MKQVPEHVDPVVGSFSNGYTTSSSRLPTTDHDAKEEMSRAEELDDLLNEAQSLIIPFIAQADININNNNNNGSNKKTAYQNQQQQDDNSTTHILNSISRKTNLVNEKSPEQLKSLLNFHLPEDPQGKEGGLSLLSGILKYSVNTWDPGFMHKLSGLTNAVGVIAELILAVLNANLHVYQVSPVLTSLEKSITRQLASMFGLKGPFAGGVTQPGGSVSNATAMVVARNELFPETKYDGYDGKKFVVFTSANSYYSIEKAAQICGFGLYNTRHVPVDDKGRMSVSELEKMIHTARDEGMTPLFVNATAGTTVLGAFDPLPEIAVLCRREKLWFHVNASWGGSAIFSSQLKYKFISTELADSLTVNPNKMMGVPVTCSYLLTSDLRRFWRSNSCLAGYLFHQAEPIDCQENVNGASTNGHADNFYDIGDLTLQCGRKGDSLKLALGWIYYGRSGYGAKIDNAFALAEYFADLVAREPHLVYVGDNLPPCLQVCFYYGRDGKLDKDKAVNSRRTVDIANGLVAKGFMVDYAPGKEGYFLRPVVHLIVNKETIERLVESVVELGCSLN